MHMRTALRIAACLVLTAALHAQTDKRPQILIIGTYHMANPGHDLFDTHADDVLAAKRQAEIAQIIDVLKRFQPTKVAVEVDSFRQKRITQRYDDYRAGKYQLTQNEIDQLGLRLAKELGHKTIYAVDADGDFPWLRVVNYAKGSGRSNELDAMIAETGDMVKADEAYLGSHTILEMLLRLNSEERVAHEAALYFREARLGEPGDWAGADLLADWFKRNIRIYANIAQLAGANDRIVVIFGSGHLAWLWTDIGANPDLRLRKLAEFVK